MTSTDLVFAAVCDRLHRCWLITRTAQSFALLVLGAQRIEPDDMLWRIGETAAGPLDDDDREIFACLYEQLRRAYQAAAAAGAGLAVLLC